MKKEKFPKLIEKIINSDSMMFKFDGGDLWKRKNVDKFDDVDACIEVIEPHLRDNKIKIKKFEWYINYSIPMDHQREQSKLYMEYNIEELNKHYFEPIFFNKSDNILYVNEGLLTANEDFISLLANKMESLKQLYFWVPLLSGGFLEDSKDQTQYIEEKLKQHSWRDFFMEIKEVYQTEFIDREEAPDDKHGNDIDALIFLRKSIDPNIKFEFNHIDDEEKKILKEHSII
jgi:hypothetical protein